MPGQRTSRVKRVPARAADVPEVSLKRILALALPTLGVLAATPLYLLFDTAVVGRLGGLALAGLAAGVTLYAQVTTQLTFLSYGTTARASQKYGSGDRPGAIAEGVQATWLALLVGAALSIIMWFGAPTFCLWLSGNAEVAQLAASWLRVASFGIPLVLIVMAGNGWMRGIQDARTPLMCTLAGIIPGALLIPYLVRHYGVVGSAWANLCGTTITASCFLWCLVRAHQGSWRLQPSVIRQQLVLGRDLIVRSLSFQVSFLSAAAVAARFGPAALAAHQILLQLWNFLTLVLDALAIAAQTLVGSAIGAKQTHAAAQIGRKIVGYSCAVGALLATAFALGWQLIPRLFTPDTAVLEVIWAGPWWQLVGMIVIGGAVFALDGILLGAADAAFLRTISLASVLLGFLPAVWIALWLDAGLTGVWWGLVAFVSIRCGAGVWRFRSQRWLPQGANH